MSKCDIFVTWLDPLENGHIFLIWLVEVPVGNFWLGTLSKQGDMGVANADNSLVKFVIFVSVTTGSIKI